MKQTSAIVLAAGLGKRMNSGLPKPLHCICGRAMILHVLDALLPLELEKVVVVVGHGSRRVIEEVSSLSDSRLKLEFVEQHTPRLHRFHIRINPSFKDYCIFSRQIRKTHS